MFRPKVRTDVCMGRSDICAVDNLEAVITDARGGLRNQDDIPEF